MRQAQVFLDNSFHVARRYRVEIKYIGDIDLHWFRKGIVEVSVVHMLI